MLCPKDIPHLKHTYPILSCPMTQSIPREILQNDVEISDEDQGEESGMSGS